MPIPVEHQGAAQDRSQQKIAQTKMRQREILPTKLSVLALELE
jgi:hypothetical protein